MTCHVTTSMGFIERMETVTSLEMNTETEGLIVNGVKDPIPNTRKDLPIFPMDSIGVYQGTKLEFFCKDGRTCSYRIKNRTDMFKVINQVNFLLELEEI